MPKPPQRIIIMTESAGNPYRPGRPRLGRFGGGPVKHLTAQQIAEQYDAQGNRRENVAAGNRPLLKPATRQPG